MIKQDKRFGLRTFIAVELSQELKDALRDVQESLIREGLSFRWVKPESMHLTIKFLGEIDKVLLPLIDKAVSEVCARNKMFSIHLKGMGSFQRKGGSAVIWAGVDEVQSLTTLHSQLEDEFKPLGFIQEERFTPHLTLGRIKILDDRVHFRQTLEKYRNLSFGTMTVSALSFMKSDLKPEGPVYTRLSHFPLTEER
jgi:2'-5' RNA ligase